MIHNTWPLVLLDTSPIGERHRHGLISVYHIADDYLSVFFLKACAVLLIERIASGRPLCCPSVSISRQARLLPVFSSGLFCCFSESC